VLEIELLLNDFLFIKMKFINFRGLIKEFFMIWDGKNGLVFWKWIFIEIGYCEKKSIINVLF
jgi:hypothetical protein